MQKRFGFCVCLFGFSHSLAVKYTMAEKSRHRELKETACIIPSVRKERDERLCSPYFCLLLQSRIQAQKMVLPMFSVGLPTFNLTIRSFYMHAKKLNNPTYVSLEDFLQERPKPRKLTSLSIMITKQKNTALRLQTM